VKRVLAKQTTERKTMRGLLPFGEGSRTTRFRTSRVRVTSGAAVSIEHASSCSVTALRRGRIDLLIRGPFSRHGKVKRSTEPGWVTPAGRMHNKCRFDSGSLTEDWSEGSRVQFPMIRAARRDTLAANSGSKGTAMRTARYQSGSPLAGVRNIVSAPLLESSRRATASMPSGGLIPAESSPESYRRRLTCCTAPLCASRRRASVKWRAESGKNLRQAR